MRIKVTLYGCKNIIPPDFFDLGGRFHRGIQFAIQCALGRENVLEQLDCVNECREVVIPRLYFVDFVLPYVITDIEKLRQLAALFGDVFREYVFTCVDCGAFIGVRISDGVHTVKWSPNLSTQ